MEGEPLRRTPGGRRARLRRRASPRAPGPGGALALAAALLALGGVGACGGDDADPRAEARETLERQFGRRDEAAAPGDSTASATAAAPDTAAGGALATPGETAPAGSVRDTGIAGRRPEPTTGAGAAPPATTPADTATSAPPTPTPAEQDAGPGVDPGRWLAMADEAYRGLPSLEARFEQRVEVPLLDRTSTGVGIWYQRGRDFFRMDFTDPPDDVFVADGTYLWLYQPSQQPGQVIKAVLAAGAGQSGTADLLGRILSEARTEYDAVYEGTETVSGVETHVIALTPRGPSDYRLVRVWIATSDRLVRRFMIQQENEMIRTVTLSRLRPGVTLADSLFRFDVPPGVDVFEP